jgi:hypothetical protein
MNVFYVEYAFLLIFIVFAAWHMLRDDVPSGIKRKKTRRLTLRGMFNNGKKSDKHGKK